MYLAWKHDRCRELWRAQIYDKIRYGITALHFRGEHEADWEAVPVTITLHGPVVTL